VKKASIPVSADGSVRLAAVSDTHSQPHPATATRLAEIAPDAILHAGDIGDLAVLDELARIAPVYAVRGNIDTRARDLPDALVLDIAAKKPNGSSEPDEALIAALVELRGRMGEIAERAAGLVSAAREADFDDIARQADSLRQQIVAVSQKVASIERALAPQRSAPG